MDRSDAVGAPLPSTRDMRHPVVASRFSFVAAYHFWSGQIDPNQPRRELFDNVVRVISRSVAKISIRSRTRLVSSVVTALLMLGYGCASKDDSGEAGAGGHA